MRPDGGGGGRVLIDPGSLTASAARLKAAVAELKLVQGGLGRTTLPALPAGSAASVHDLIASASAGLVGDTTSLGDTVVELTRRAFLAQYADQMMSGYVLTGAARQEFVQWMKDGSLMKFSNDYDADAAGAELAHLYSGFRKDPKQLIDLAACLKGSLASSNVELERTFSSSFVNEFGAKNMELVPRVIQGMEWSRTITGNLGFEPHVLADVAREWQGNDLHANPLRDLLAPFSLALANATVSGQLTRTTEDEIANDPDTWATAALVSSGVFSTQFLLKVFRTGVVDKIAQDSVYGSGLGEAPHDAPYMLGRMWSHGKDGLPYDTKQIVLDALARNPDAAAAAFTQHLHGVQAMDRFGQRQDMTDPLQLLYTYGHFDDHGAAFGHAYAAATDHLDADPSDLAARGQGAHLTGDAITLVLANDHDGVAAFKDGLATDLARNHVGDLFSSAIDMDQGDSGGPVHIYHGTEIRLSVESLPKTLRALGDRPSALGTLLHSASIYQGALIHNGTARQGGSVEWAYKAAAFDANVLTATDLRHLDQFDAQSERHQLVAGFFKSAINDAIAIDNPVASAVLHTGVDAAVDHAFPGPDPEKLVLDNADAKALVTNSLHAAIVGGYYEHGQLHSDGARPPASIAPDGRLISYGDVSGDARWDYEQWMNGNSHVENVARPALLEVSRAFQERSVDLVG
jgi:hypothetical protein